MRAKRAKKKYLKIEVSRAKRGKFFLETFGIFPPLLASLEQIIYFFSRRGQIIYFKYF